jgi:hypothetical protein
MYTHPIFTLFFGLLAFAGGILFGWWLLAYAGVLLAAVCGRFVLALLLAMVLDLMYGAPTGMFQYIAFPFVVFTLIVVLVQAFLVRHIREGYYR